MMTIRKILVVAVVLVLALSVFATGCKAAPKLAETQVLRLNIGTEPPQLNSTISTDTVSFNIMRHTMEGLTRLDADNKPVPGVASKWTSSADGLTWTFTLRDTKWSDGTPVTAQDFEFSWKTLLNPETASEYAYFAYIIKGGQAYNSGEGSVDDVGVKAIDAKTLQVVLEQPCSYFLDSLAFGVMLPVKQSFYEQVGAANYGADVDKMLFNGGYVVETWNHEQNITLKKNANYWDAKNVYIQTVELDMVVDAQAAFTKFLAGDYDVQGLANSDFIAQSEAQGFETKTFSDGAVFYLELNLKDPNLANLNIRKAIALAVNRQDFITKILKDKSVPATGLVHPQIKGAVKPTYREEAGDLIPATDLTAAKAAYAKGLEELGVSEIKVTLIVDDGDIMKARGSALAENLQQSLGIVVEKLEQMPFKSRLQRMKDGDFTIVWAGWGPDYNDPMTYLDMFETGNGNNHVEYSDAAYDKLVADARKEADNKKRYELYKQMETKLMTDLPIVPLYFRNRAYTTRPEVKGLVRSAFQDLSWMHAYIEAE